jgi:hypothetical protein
MACRSLRFVTLAAVLLMPALASAQQMPDPKKISGVPLPMSDMAVGTVTVRVIRGQLTNVLPDQSVELTGAGAPRTASTDSAGRAQFTGLQPGTRVKASVTVAGERIESQEFAVPISGGVRLMLVATDAETEKKAAEDRQLAQGPAVKGMVVLGDQTKFVVEVGDDDLNVFNIVQIVNTARTPVEPAAPIVFDLPKGASGAGIMEGSAPNAALAGKQVTVRGPFPPGNTLVQFAYSLALTDERLTIEQRLPAQLMALSVIAQKASEGMHLSSSQLSGQREMSAEGQTYIVAQGPAVRAGDAISITLSGLPHHPTWPRNLALVVAGTILAAGFWAASRRRPGTDGAETSRLHARRDRLFTELTALEQQKHAGTIDEGQYASRRQDLMSALETVYRQLDDRQVA